MGTKVCSACKLEKPHSDFYGHTYSKDGYHNQCKACIKIYRDSNKERQKQYKKDWDKTNKEYLKEFFKAHYQANKTAYRAKGAKYRASQLRATPSWADLSCIKDFYECALAFRLYTGKEYHVDHIVPLQGKTVCGLHCEANLQVLPSVENVSKGNRWWPDMP
jgi:hypothetical protein